MTGLDSVCMPKGGSHKHKSLFSVICYNVSININVYFFLFIVHTSLDSCRLSHNPTEQNLIVFVVAVV